MAKIPCLALLLAMAMFVLVVETSLMNVSIASVVEDIRHTVQPASRPRSCSQALGSAALIPIGSKIGDLGGRKRLPTFWGCSATPSVPER